MARIEQSKAGLADAEKRAAIALRDVSIYRDNLANAQQELDAILAERRKRNGG